MAEVGTISAMDNDGALHEASIRDDAARLQIEEMYVEYNKILEFISQNGNQ